MSNVISFAGALKMAIKDLQKPVLSKFEIFYLALHISKSNSYQGKLIRKQITPFGIKKTFSLIGTLLKERFISKDSDFRFHYKVADEARGNCDEVACLVDPFCYLSHLSAMQKYGLTNRIPEVVILTTAESKLWNQMKIDLELKYRGDLLGEVEYLPLRKVVFPQVVRKMKIRMVESKFFHQSVKAGDSQVRISEVGHTFLDMLINPELCGGMSHVLDVWKANAKTYLDEIIDAVEGHPQKIIKVRAGYIIEEVLETQNDRVNKWQEFAQRGGSRLLDPNSSYAPKFSEKWMISINV
jgi:predicted transcriptional regulator of viral defense system